MGKILQLLFWFAELITKLRKMVGAQKLIDAKDESLEKGDQRKLEQAMGGEGGPSRTEYDGMYEREPKKPE